MAERINKTFEGHVKTWDTHVALAETQRAFKPKRGINAGDPLLVKTQYVRPKLLSASNSFAETKEFLVTHTSIVRPNVKNMIQSNLVNNCKNRRQSRNALPN